MRKLAACLSALGPLLLSATMTAQSATESLLIGPGDLLHVRVYDTPEMTQDVRVDDAGNAPLLFVGDVHVSGQTPAQAATGITMAMVAKQVMRHPQVAIKVEQYAKQDVSVLGQVNKPGNYPLATPRSVLDVLSMAGGLAPLASRQIVIRHHGQSGEQTFFAANDANEAIAGDLQVGPGDTILVPKANFVYVLGDVARPGGYPLNVNDRPMTLLQTLSEAGSPNRSAVLSHAKLIRKHNGNYEEVPFDIAQIEKGRKPDVELKSDDVLFIPFSYAKNFVINGTSVAASVASAVLYTH